MKNNKAHSSTSTPSLLLLLLLQKMKAFVPAQARYDGKVLVRDVGHVIRRGV